MKLTQTPSGTLLRIERNVVRVDRSPMNKRIKIVGLDCGHDYYTYNGRTAEFHVDWPWPRWPLDLDDMAWPVYDRAARRRYHQERDGAAWIDLGGEA